MITETQSETDREIVNNAYYDTLESWTDPNVHPVALLRAEGLLKNQWVVDTLRAEKLSPRSILDVGCGGGLLTNFLAQEGYQVTGIDLSEPSLAAAAKMDSTKSVVYRKADAYDLPFNDGEFSVVTCFDFLEHVSDPNRVIQEIMRVLAPGGLFFYHTFNKNWVAHLIAIKGVEWFVKGTPSKLHVIALFIKPKTLHKMLDANSFALLEERGLRPRLGLSFIKMLFTRRIDKNFSFVWTKYKTISYAGLAQKLR
jgi:2-polyprenyl-6-hydroxyphenyl methylase / 3-demethylubiquinone-9 3-methyltransferase